MSIPFTIRWLAPLTGREFTTNYVYDGCACQKGYDLIGWCLRCLNFGLSEGFKASVHDIKLKNQNDYTR